MKKVTQLDESIISDIGHAFGYYDYGDEHGLIDAFSSRDAAAAFICGYVRMALKSGMLYTTGENGEGYIAYKLPGQRVSISAGYQLAKGFLSAMKLSDIFQFSRIMSKGGAGLSKQFDRAKKPYIFVGMVCVREKYQGQGYMPLRYNNDKRKKPLFSRGSRVCRHLFNYFSKLKSDEKNIKKRRLFH